MWAGNAEKISLNATCMLTLLIGCDARVEIDIEIESPNDTDVSVGETQDVSELEPKKQYNELSPKKNMS